jgi:hypothetical protein
MTSLTPLTRTTNAEHRAELARQRAVDQKNIENQSLRDERALALQRGELRAREAALREREEALREERAALDRQRDMINLERAEHLLTDGDDVPRPSKQQMDLAEQILNAGRRRRAEIPDDTMPPRGSLAFQIVQAGRKRRGEE